MSKFFYLVLCCCLLCSCIRAPEPPLSRPEPTHVPTVPAPLLTPVVWEALPGWQKDELTPAFDAFLQSCVALRRRPQWRDVCESASAFESPSETTLRDFFESAFTPHQVLLEDGSADGLLTGYYVPDLKGSRQASSDYPYPLYQRPDDLLTIDLSDVYPELGNYRLRGRLEGNRVVPYWDRGVIDGAKLPLSGRELFWVADPVELFYLHIQGSGSILFDDGTRAMVNYADQNGHPFRSISHYLEQQKIMPRSQMSMRNIRDWVKKNPERSGEILSQNPSYIFFRELEEGTQSPPGALGVPLTPERTLAVDSRYIPLGAPVFIESHNKHSDIWLRRLMMAQDRGGAIKGRVRGDFFWGLGDVAGALAGQTHQPVKFWLLLPKELDAPGELDAKESG
ncbi:MAG: murein transglycosylase A [Desulfuromonadales bacterium]|nr:murein transglycosylase A [Desulfuromonadales bacterium]